MKYDKIGQIKLPSKRGCTRRRRKKDDEDVTYINRKKWFIKSDNSFTQTKAMYLFISLTE